MVKHRKFGKTEKSQNIMKLIKVRLAEDLLWSPDTEFNKITSLEPGPKRKLSLEAKFLLGNYGRRPGFLFENFARENVTDVYNLNQAYFKGIECPINMVIIIID